MGRESIPSSPSPSASSVMACAPPTPTIVPLSLLLRLSLLEGEAELLWGFLEALDLLDFRFFSGELGRLLGLARSTVPTLGRSNAESSVGRSDTLLSCPNPAVKKAGKGECGSAVAAAECSADSAEGLSREASIRREDCTGERRAKGLSSSSDRPGSAVGFFFDFFPAFFEDLCGDLLLLRLSGVSSRASFAAAAATIC